MKAPGDPVAGLSGHDLTGAVPVARQGRQAPKRQNPPPKKQDRKAPDDDTQSVEQGPVTQDAGDHEIDVLA